MRAEPRELTHAIGTLGDEDAHRVGIAQARAGSQRVDEVQIGRVGRGQRRGHAALRVARRGMRQLALGQHEHGQAPARRVERSRQPRDATPQHEDVVHNGQPRCRLGRSRIQTRFEPARCTASSASIGRFASSTCTIRGAYDASSASS